MTRESQITNHKLLIQTLSTEEIRIIKKVFTQYMDGGFLLWPAMLNFNSFMVCLNNLHQSINYTYQKEKVTRDEKMKKEI